MGFEQGKENLAEFANAPEPRTRAARPRRENPPATREKISVCAASFWGLFWVNSACPRCQDASASSAFVRACYFEVVVFAAAAFNRSIAFLACSASGPFGRILR
jgi:hypothetical protein